MKSLRILFYVALGLVGLGIASLVVSTVLDLAGNSELSDTFLLISSISGTAALVVLIVRLVIGVNNQPVVTPNKQVKKEVKIVDVKPIEKTKEEKLYDQYVELCKQKLITEEELEQKRIELLGK